uniref:fasciclin-like arabinogalactan protein 21 n=1 Tax=Erigeron canadensis TaxID=72917 RepID=UPI001CB90F97|nr:fasciclin-like arabinogalactan protein 21 [Erigeron canadensis]
MGKGVFFTSASILLAIIITATLLPHHHHYRRHHDNPPPNSSPPVPGFTSNASQLLRSNGFNFIATFLHISPDLFLPTPQSTIFAISDSTFSNLSIPPYLMRHFLEFHISPSRFTFPDLLNKPISTCFPTLVQEKRIGITKNDDKRRVLEINNVLITHPDLFLHGSLAIHGLAGSFASFDHLQESLVFPVCEEGHKIDVGFIKNNKDEWGKVVKFLGTSGFMPFAIGLKSVTDGIFKDFPNLKSLTIFTPPNAALMAMSWPLFDKFMRFHIIPERYSLKQLAGLSAGASLRTLVMGKDVEITEASKVSKVVSINGVMITVPDMFVSKNVVVHGIARPFDINKLSSISR